MRGEESEVSNRRAFLRRAGVSLAALAALPAASSGAGTPPSVSLASAGEPGERIVVSGRIFAADGVTPLAGATLYVYHTDARGYYSESDGRGGPPQPRLKGRVVTDREGRYEFRSIRPAPYPGGTNPSHVHASVTAAGGGEQWIHNYLFADDALVPVDMRARLNGQGRFSPLLSLARGADGVLRGTRDIKLERV